MNTTTEVTVPFLLADAYTDLYHKAQVAFPADEEDDLFTQLMDEWYACR